LLVITRNFWPSTNWIWIDEKYLDGFFFIKAVWFVGYVAVGFGDPEPQHGNSVLYRLLHLNR